MGLYTLIDSFKNKTLFMYLIIILIAIIFFRNMNINLNILLGLFIAISFILYLNEKEILSNELFEKQIDTKLDTIKPVPYKLKERRDLDFIDFLFSIQDLYAYNPLAYEELIDNIESFLKVYENIFGEDKFVNYYYQIAEDKKNNALNSLHSFIHTIPTDRLMIDKYDRAHKRLETIFNKYINEIYDRCSHILLKNGYNVFARQINTGPKEANHYFDKEFTYQFY